MEPAASAVNNKDAGSHLSSDLKLPSIESDSPNDQTNGVPTAATKPDLPSTKKLPPLESKAVSKTPVRRRSISFKLAHTTDEDALDKEQEQEDKKRTSAVVADPDVEPSEEEVETLVLEFIDEVTYVSLNYY